MFGDPPVESKPMRTRRHASGAESVLIDRTDRLGVTLLNLRLLQATNAVPTKGISYGENRNPKGHPSCSCLVAAFGWWNAGHGRADRLDGLLRSLSFGADPDQQLQYGDHCRTAGLRTQGMARSLQRARYLAFSMEQRQDRHRSSDRCSSFGHFSVLAHFPHQYSFCQRVCVWFLDFLFPAA